MQREKRPRKWEYLVETEDIIIVKEGMIKSKIFPQEYVFMGFC